MTEIMRCRGCGEDYDPQEESHVGHTAENGRPAFRVVEEYPVVVMRERVVIETDDWLAAEAAVLDHERTNPKTMQERAPRLIRGVHPSHEWPAKGNPCCVRCGAWNNGSYGSHAPCGTKFTKSLYAMVEDWRDQGNPPGTPVGETVAEQLHRERREPS